MGGSSGRIARGDATGSGCLEWLGDRLNDATYHADGLRELVGARFPDDVGLLNHAPTLERLRGDESPRAVLTRFFFLEAAEPGAALRRSFSRAEWKQLVVQGLVERLGSKWIARLRVDAVQGLHVLADRRFRLPDAAALGLPRGDMVYPIGADSVILAEATASVHGCETLDLCAGTGVQGLLLAARAERVTAVDIGSRAVAMARANARLNHVGNLTAACGDLYRPVEQRRFDCIVANPPFVASRRRGPAYHSGGPSGDDVLEPLLRGLGAHLRPRGRALLVTHLALRAGENAADRLRPWLREFPGRALALLLEEGGPVDLAAAQSVFALDRGFTAYAREVERWIGFLRRHHVERVVLALLVAERSRRRGVDVVEAFQRSFPLPLSHPSEEHIRRSLV